jgi:peptidoglycan/xylan/chitin deacetylase (PgdA/CDA1 family)
VSAPHPQADTAAGAAPLRIAFLTGADTESTRRSIEAACEVSGVIPAAVLLDIAKPPFSRRVENLRRNLRREGWTYAGERLLYAIRERLDRWAAAVAPAAEVDALLREAFPERPFTLQDLARKYGFDIVPVNNLNSPEAAERLRATGAALGVVLGTRILKRSTFSVPALGCINLHKGKVPQYRGMPPGFWEVYDGAPTAGVTVHFVDDGLDTGDIVRASEFPLHAKETPESLQAKLNLEGAKILAEALRNLQQGTAAPWQQPPVTIKPRTRPTRAQERELRVRAPHIGAPRDWQAIVKTALYLAIWRSGLWRFLRRRRRRPAGKAAILLHHRVNDIARDPLTTGTREFAAQLVMLRRYYRVLPTSEIVEKIKNREYIDPETVAIHFDDCYRDVYSQASRILEAAGVPATFFIASGFIDTDRVFPHDAAKYPHRFENLRSEDVRGLLDRGVEVGAHTVNHVNLGEIEIDQARDEVFASKQALEVRTGRAVKFFSFPFGEKRNIREQVRGIVRDAGFEALFSAHGGFASGASDVWAIPRIGVSGRDSALELMMRLEGVSAGDLSARFGRRTRSDANARS